MKIVKRLLAILVIVIIGFSIYVALQPNDYEVTRSRTIKTPANLVYNNVIDYKNWETWSSWIEQHPETKITYPENTKGVGGHYSWEDDDGVGTMKTIATIANKSIDQEMQFDDFEPSKVTWTFNEHANGTTDVTWKMSGNNIPFMFKAYAAMSGGFDNMIGPDFDRGLEKLDSLTVVEYEKQKTMINAFKLSEIKEVDLPSQTFIGYQQKTTTKIAMESMSGLFMKYMPMAGQYVSDKLKQDEYTPGCYYVKWDEEKNEAEFYIGLLLKKSIEPGEGMTALQLPVGKTLIISKFGNYGTGELEARNAITKYLESKNLKQKNTISWDLYVNDPTLVKPEEIQTDIYLPVN